MANKNITGKGMAQFVQTKIGTPYVYGAKGSDGILTQSRLNQLAKSYPDIFTPSYISKANKLVGKVCTDCSGLEGWYTGNEIGSYQLYATATRRGLIKDIDNAPIGAVLWKPGHVGTYIGNGYCVEAKGIDYGTVRSKVSDTHFTHWLLFEGYMAYDTIIHVTTTKKGVNPFPMPTTDVVFGDTGVSVKWVQWELNEAGIKTKIDGNYGSITDKNVKTYQRSCKIKVDGAVGKITRKYFIND